MAVNGLVSNPLSFAVANPLLSNVFPSSAARGTILPAVTLKGSKFASNATVTFGGAAGDITFTPSSVVVSADGTTITIAGVSVSGTAALGVRSATVTSAGGSSTLANAFTVTAPQPVTIVASVNGGDPSLFLPSVKAVSVTLDSTGKCIAPKSVTPQPLTLAFTLTPGPGHTVTATSSTMALTMTSTNIPGTATNEDCELGATPTNDFSFFTIAAGISIDLGGLPSLIRQQTAVTSPLASSALLWRN